jgi:AcrR family transcriptional regulator
MEGGHVTDVGRSTRHERLARTREGLIEAALQLFADNGFDETTTDQIAAKAGVSPRTFFRHFPTKESVLFSGEYDFMRLFAGALMAQDPDLPDFEAICRTLVVLAPRVDPLRERVRLYELAIASSMLLRGREQATLEDNITVMAEAIAERRGLDQPDEACEILSSLSGLALRRALQAWLTGPPRRRLAELIPGEFEQLAAVVDRARASRSDS